MSVIGTVQTRCVARFDRIEICQHLNQHHLGMKHCNKWDEEKQRYVDACEFPKEFVEAQEKICPNVSFVIEADVDENGNLFNFRVKNGEVT